MKKKHHRDLDENIIYKYVRKKQNTHKKNTLPVFVEVWKRDSNYLLFKIDVAHFWIQK